MKNTETLHRVPWKDLTRLSRFDRWYELLLSAPWLLASWYFATGTQWFFALLCSFMFFLTGLRQVHNGYHLTLGLDARRTGWFLHLMSVLMLTAMHAVKFNHLQHHKHCLQEGDIEGSCARMPFWKVILYGPVFPLKIHRNALKNAPETLKKKIKFELALIVFCWAVLLALDIPFLKYHFFAMVLGECGTAFFAVWTVHHHCSEDQPWGRTLRGRWNSIISYNMFYHAEHHLFPAVPTCRLDELAERIDVLMPDIAEKSVV